MKSAFIRGVRVHAPASEQQLLEHILRAKIILVAVNAEKVMQSSESLKTIINENFGYPDGFGVAMGLRRKGFTRARKIAGCELWLKIIARCYRYKKFYLVGGTSEVIQATVAKLQREFVGIEIVGYRDGYLKNETDKAELINDVMLKTPDVVFVAMGSPLQEKLMSELHAKHKALYQGLGGSFDIYTGKTVRAPAWWVEHNLEWLFRLIKQPRRIRRQAALIPFFLMLILGKM